MHTVGIVLNDSTSYITLTDTVGPDETASVHTIPKCMVKRLQYIDNYIQGGPIYDFIIYRTIRT